MPPEQTLEMSANTLNLTYQFQRVLGKRIKERRRELKFTQVQLSNLAGISRAALANIEAGNQRTSVFLLACLADAMEIPSCDLIPNLTEAKDSLREARRTSVTTAGNAKLLTRELKKFNIIPALEGNLKSTLKRIQHQHKNRSPEDRGESHEHAIRKNRPKSTKTT